MKRPTHKLILRSFRERDLSLAFGAYMATVDKYPDSKTIIVKQNSMTKAVLVKRNKKSTTATVEP